MRTFVLLIALAGVLAVGVPAAVAGGVAEPAYTVVAEDGGFQLREYDPQIRAETVVEGPYKDALNDGFRILAAYIFGGNVASEQIAMTAPVGAETAGVDIAMTAPVGAEPTAAGWKVSFVMPAGYTLATLPRPLDPRVSLREIPSARVAALRFSGWAPEDKVQRKQAELLTALRAAGLDPLGAPVVAQYNPPWTLPFLRRNEILVPVR